MPWSICFHSEDRRDSSEEEDGEVGGSGVNQGHFSPFSTLPGRRRWRVGLDVSSVESSVGRGISETPRLISLGLPQGRLFVVLSVVLPPYLRTHLSVPDFLV